MSRILVLDDEPGYRDLLKEVLERAGYTVLPASPPEAMRLIPHSQFDLLLVDNRMPEISGLDFIRHVRAGGCQTPTIVMTAYAELPVVVESMRLGALDFLIKPFLIEDLILAVERATRKSVS